jgi:DNA-binding CsgD family transcriptional regulator
MIALPYAADDLDWRRDLQRQAEAGFERAGGMVSSQAVRVVRLPLLSLEGHWLEALETGRAAWAVRESGEAWWDRVTAPVLATIALARGEPATAWALVRAHHPSGPATAPGNTYFHAGLTLQRLAAALAIDADNLDEARSWLTAHDRWLVWSGAVLGRAEGAAAWAAYHRAAGDPALARQYSERALAFAEAPRQPLALLGAHRVLGEVDAADGRRAEADDHLNAALALADACAAPFERALTLLALAELRHASEEDTAASRLLDAARAICSPLGARPALDRAQALVTRLSAQDSCGTAFPARLTAREEEVLRLVAQGLSNSEVAARLFLSTRTIEQHLRSIYDKLDVSSRTAAAHFATEHHLI